MKIIDNTSLLLGDDLKATLGRGARIKIAASCFSIYAFEALKAELSKVESLQFIFTAPTFVATDVTDRLRKERREFFIPKTTRERGLYGTEFEIQLRNKLTQRAVARECAEWIRKKARFKSNKTKAPMQQFIHAGSEAGDVAGSRQLTWATRRATRSRTSLRASTIPHTRRSTCNCSTRFGTMRTRSATSPPPFATISSPSTRRIHRNGFTSTSCTASSRISSKRSIRMRCQTI